MSERIEPHGGNAGHDLHGPDPEALAEIVEHHQAERAVPWWGATSLVAFVALVVCGYIATGVAPSWAADRPLELLALNARVRHLLLAIGGGVEWWPYFFVAGLRLALAYFVCHLIGRAYSERALVMFGKYLGHDRAQMTKLIGGFDKVDWAIVPFFAGSNIVAAISGIRRMHPLRLVILLTIGIVGRLALYWWLGQQFDTQLASILDFVTRWQMPLTIASIALVFVTVGLNVRRGRKFG